MDDKRLYEGLTSVPTILTRCWNGLGIRSEKRFYQKIRDFYKLAVDYDTDAKETLNFSVYVQNKLP